MVVGFTYPALREEQIKSLEPEQITKVVYNYLGDMGAFMHADKRPYNLKASELDDLGLDPVVVDIKYRRFLPATAMVKLLDVFARHPNRSGERLQVPLHENFVYPLAI